MPIYRTGFIARVLVGYVCAVLGMVALPDLPVPQPHDERRRGEHEHDQEQEQAAPRIGSTQHGVSLASGRG